MMLRSWFTLAVLLLLNGTELIGETIYRSGLIAADTVWETQYHVIDSGEEGPTVLIFGGIHGNEPAGWRAAEQVRHWPVVKGKLVVVPRSNVPGLEAGSRYLPGEAKEAADLNRNFPREKVGDGEERVMPRGQLAMALWKFAAKVRPDWVIDLHEGYEFNRSHQPPEGKKKSVGSSVIYRGSDKMDPLVERVVDAANATVKDEKKRFTMLRTGPVSTGMARACIEVMGAEALILETTYTDQPLSLRTRQHRAMLNVLLNHIGLVERDCQDLFTGSKSEDTLQVGIFDGAGTGRSKNSLYSIVDQDVSMNLSFIGSEEMKAAVLNQFDVVIFPGGSGSRQAEAIGQRGREAICEFVRNGGGFVGVCAGAYLCSSHYSWSLDLIDTAVFTGAREIPGKGTKQMWYRGKSAEIEIELTKSGQERYPGLKRELVVRYANGPIVSQKGHDGLEDYEILAWFRSENGLWEPQRGTMINTPAIVSGSFGQGRVISISPHPESTPELHSMISNSLRWVAGLEPVTPPQEALELEASNR